ncbi:hypothetical protein Tco_1479033, partial [Tanacetum coccineum]
IQQYLQHEHYALWEVIEFGDSYKARPEETGKGVTSESSAKKKGRTVAITTEDIFNKYDNAKELWEAILKTFGGNEATKKTKKNKLKQQYGNFKAEGLETLEQTFNRLQAIVSHLEFMDVPIEQDDWKRISDKRTKNQAKNDKTEHEMKKCGKEKVKVNK